MPRVEVNIDDSGQVSMTIEGMHYIQLYGVAEVLHEQARHQQQMHLVQEAAKQGGIAVVRGMPGDLQG